MGAVTCGVGSICRRWGSASDGYSEEDFLDDEARVEISECAFPAGAGLDLLCFPGRTPPRGRGDVRGLRFSHRHRRLCYMSPEGKPGTAGLSFVPAAVLGILGLLGTVVGAVLPLTRSSNPVPFPTWISSAVTPNTVANAIRRLAACRTSAVHHRLCCLLRRSTQRRNRRLVGRSDGRPPGHHCRAK
jgi:hypothetical protein